MTVMTLSHGAFVGPVLVHLAILMVIEGEGWVLGHNNKQID